MKIPNSVTRAFHKQVLLTKKNSPQILFVTGVAGLIGTTVLASRATVKASDVVHIAKQDIAVQKRIIEFEEDDAMASRANENVNRICLETGLSLCKLYAPAVLVGVGTVVAFGTSNRILTKRNAALGAAYAVLDKSYKKYREVVQENVGVEKEKDFHDQVCDMGDGEKKPLSNDRGTRLSGGAYRAHFGPTNENWSPTHEYNEIFLDLQENIANQRLATRGYVMLNDIYDALGFERTSAGQVVGWWLGGDGDDFIDFGITNNGVGSDFTLSFNPDGVVYQNISG